MERWASRELQALLLQDDVALVAAHVLGTARHAARAGQVHTESMIDCITYQVPGLAADGSLEYPQHQLLLLLPSLDLLEALLHSHVSVHVIAHHPQAICRSHAWLLQQRCRRRTWSSRHTLLLSSCAALWQLAAVSLLLMCGSLVLLPLHNLQDQVAAHGPKPNLSS